MKHATDCTLASQPSKSRYSPIVDAISGKRDFRKTTENRSKIGPSAHFDAAARRFRDFSRFRRRLGVDFAGPGAARDFPGRRFGSPENPQGAPGLPRGVLGTLPGRPGNAPRCSRDASGAPLVPRGRFLIDFGCPGRLPGAIFGRFSDRFWRHSRIVLARESLAFRADFCNWWTNHKDRLTVRLTRRLTRWTA